MTTVDPTDETLPRGNGLGVTPAEGGTGRRLLKESLKHRMFGEVVAAPTIGRYTVLRVLGEGGMGTVVACYDEQLDRKVAVKLVKGTESEEARRRMLREAQAMAKLSHPNVVPVFEVGEHEGQLFVAMEFVRGRPLNEWREADAPGWREILAKYVQAGQGLDAAHAAGIVHRDFKPGNAVIGDDGRVRVLDFGLARRGEAAGEEDDPPTPTDRAGAFDTPLTQTGAVMGTPAYMPPEQFRGGDVDHRSDQFSFCVALWEALFSERPFAGSTPSELMVAVSEGEIARPKRTDVPATVRSVVERGLRPEPADRWPGMDELLAKLQALDVDPALIRRTRRRVAAFGVGTFVIVVGGFIGQRELERMRSEGCRRDATAEIEAIWNPEIRDSVRAAMVATDSPIAEVTADHTLPRLDRHAEAWRDARGDACIDTVARREWSDADLERSRWCLERRSTKLRALVESLAEADVGTLSRAVSAAAGLEPVAACRDREWLARMPAPPPAEARAAVVEVQGELARAGAAEATGRYASALSLSREALARASEQGDPSLVASAQLSEGDALVHTGDLPLARARLQDAYFGAVHVRDFAVAFSAAASLADLVGVRQGEFDDGRLWARHAQSALDALGAPDDHPYAAVLEGTIASIDHDAGNYEPSIEHRRRALEIGEATLGEDHPGLATHGLALSLSLMQAGKVDEARAEAERALVIQQGALGEGHPDVAFTLSGLGDIQSAQGDNVAAVGRYEAALVIREQIHGREHPIVGYTLGQLANARFFLGELDAAEAAYVRAISILEASQGPESPAVASSLIGLGAVQGRRGDAEAARASFTRALAIQEKALGPEHPFLAFTLGNLAHGATEAGRYDDGLALAERALAIRQKALGAEHPLTAASLADVAQVHQLAGRPTEATTYNDQALAIFDAVDGVQAGEAAARFRAAELRVATDGDLAKARSFAKAAREDLEASGSDPDALAEVDAWLKAHP